MSELERWKARGRTIKVLGHHFRHFKNWPVVFSNYLKKRPMDRMELRNGIVLLGSPIDDTWSIFKEIYIEECYTGGGFYIPKDGDVVLDCGGNIGFFSTFIAKKAKVKVYSFEPVEETIMRLKKNLAGNGIENQVTILPYGLGDKDGVVKISIAAAAGSSSMSGSFGGDEISIKIRPLPDVVRELGIKKIHFIKMDIEGAEVEVLKGLDNATWALVERIAMEYHEDVRPGSLTIVRELLKKNFKHVEEWPTTPNGKLGIIRAQK